MKRKVETLLTERAARLERAWKKIKTTSATVPTVRRSNQREPCLEPCLAPCAKRKRCKSQCVKGSKYCKIHQFKDPKSGLVQCRGINANYRQCIKSVPPEQFFCPDHLKMHPSLVNKLNLLKSKKAAEELHTNIITQNKFLEREVRARNKQKKVDQLKKNRAKKMQITNHKKLQHKKPKKKHPSEAQNTIQATNNNNKIANSNSSSTIQANSPGNKPNFGLSLLDNKPVFGTINAHKRITIQLSSPQRKPLANNVFYNG